MANWTALRLQVFERDGGICRLCGIDCRWVRRVAIRLTTPTRGLDALMFFRAFVGWDKSGSFWECDHICPREAGGGDEPENLRTLCSPCHRGETSRYAGLRAAGRKTLNKDQWPTRTLKNSIPSRPFRQGHRKLRWQAK